MRFFFPYPISCTAPQGDRVRQELPTVARKGMDKELSPSQREEWKDGVISSQNSNKFLLLLYVNVIWDS